MALNDYETSAERGQPVELYTFTYGENAGRYHAYTNAENAITHEGVTYETLPIKRGKIKTKGRADGREISIDVPLYAGIAELFRIFPPGRTVTATIRQGHAPSADDPVGFEFGQNFEVIWVGRVLESRRNGNRATLTCESAAAGMKRVGLRLHYQWPCPLALYSTRCGANKAASKVTTTGTGSGSDIILPAAWNGAFAAADFIGGLVEWASVDGREYRTILRVRDATTLLLNAAANNLPDGDPVDVFLGCPHTLAACTSLHSNAVNFGGQPFIPLINPVGKNNHT